MLMRGVDGFRVEPSGGMDSENLLASRFFRRIRDWKPQCLRDAFYSSGCYRSR